MTFRKKLKLSWQHWIEILKTVQDYKTAADMMESENCACCEYSEYNYPCERNLNNCPISMMSQKFHCRNTPYLNACFNTKSEKIEQELMYLQLCYYWHGFKGEIWE